MDGNCQFHAVVDQLHMWNLDSNASHNELRSKVVEQLRDNPNTSDGSCSLQYFVTTDFSSYLQKMSENGEFGDNITLKAVCELYDTQIVVVSSNTNFSPLLVSSSNRYYNTDKSCLILGHFDESTGEHYVSLELSASGGSKQAIDEYMSVIFNIPVVLNLQSSTTEDQQLSRGNNPRTVVGDLGTSDSRPVQPKLQQFPMTKFGSQNRGFSVKFYNEYPFIEYSIANNAVFCFPCRVFPCGFEYTALTTGDGIQDWKNLAYKLRKHASS